ncbi:hypothetical protein HDU82_002365 [Entophlyctis luteolus]|nr:hypothetical protein HDU82_002365 [Entophlyctis luteolus]
MASPAEGTVVRTSPFFGPATTHSAVSGSDSSSLSASASTTDSAASTSTSDSPLFALGLGNDISATSTSPSTSSSSGGGHPPSSSSSGGADNRILAAILVPVCIVCFVLGLVTSRVVKRRRERRRKEAEEASAATVAVADADFYDTGGGGDSGGEPGAPVFTESFKLKTLRKDSSNTKNANSPTPASVSPYVDTGNHMNHRRRQLQQNTLPTASKFSVKINGARSHSDDDDDADCAGEAEYADSAVVPSAPSAEKLAYGLSAPTSHPPHSHMYYQHQHLHSQSRPVVATSEKEHIRIPLHPIDNSDDIGTISTVTAQNEASSIITPPPLAKIPSLNTTKRTSVPLRNYNTNSTAVFRNGRFPVADNSIPSSNAGARSSFATMALLDSLEPPPPYQPRLEVSEEYDGEIDNADSFDQHHPYRMQQREQRWRNEEEYEFSSDFDREGDEGFKKLKQDKKAAGPSDVMCLDTVEAQLHSSISPRPEEYQQLRHNVDGIMVETPAEVPGGVEEATAPQLQELLTIVVPAIDPVLDGLQELQQQHRRYRQENAHGRSRNAANGNAGDERARRGMRRWSAHEATEAWLA